MSAQHEVVEGQGLARAVLDALDRRHTPDWEALDRTYRADLLRVAGARLRRYDQAGRLQPEDVLHEFLLARVYPPEQARKMFGPTARGERPLRLRLQTSLANFCVDLVRAAHRRREQLNPGAALANAPASAHPLPTYEEVASLLGRQMAAIRKVCPPRQRPDGAAYREALLLRLRLDWAGAFDGTSLRSEGGGEVSLTLDVLETLTAWTKDEVAMPLVEGGPPLWQVWDRVRPPLLAAPGRELTPACLVPLIPTSRLAWNQWNSRGRRHLRDALGEEFDVVFAIWRGMGGGA
jgi:hypothetical protein